MTRSAREQGDMAVATDGTLSLELNASLNAVLTIRVELGVRSTALLTDDCGGESTAGSGHEHASSGVVEESNACADNLDCQSQILNGDATGGITWCESYVLNGILSHYRSSTTWGSALSCLSVFVKHADAVIAQRDDVARRYAQLPIWSSTKFTMGVPYATVVSTGMITAPIALFATIVSDLAVANSTRLDDGRTLSEVATSYRERVVESVAHHDAQWLPWKNGTGTYHALPNTSSFYCDDSSCSKQHYPLARYQSLPFNMQNALGRTLLALASHYCDPRFYDPTRCHQADTKVQGLAMYWKEWLTQVTSSSGVAYTWPYWGEQSTTETVDMEHAEISMRFAVDYFQTRRGSHLNLSDMQALARTVRDGIVCGPGPISFLDILVCRCLSLGTK